MRHFLLICLIVIVASSISATPVRADGATDTFAVSAFVNPTDTVTFTWQLPASPTPDFSYPGLGFEIDNVGVSAFDNGVFQSTSTDSLVFYVDGYPINLADGTGSTINFEFTSNGNNALYSNGELSPIFNLGGTDGTISDATGATFGASLNVAPVPEASSVVFWLVGFLALAGVLVARKQA